MMGKGFKILYFGLILLAICFLCIGLFAGCRTVKKNKSKEIVTYDSSGRKSAESTKETVTNVKFDTGVTFNPGNLWGFFNPLDTNVQFFASDSYELSIKPGPYGKGSFDLKGKDQKVLVSGERTTNTKETFKEDEKSTLNKASLIERTEKKTWSLPIGVWVFGFLVIIAACVWLYKRIKK